MPWCLPTFRYTYTHMYTASSRKLGICKWQPSRSDTGRARRAISTSPFKLAGTINREIGTSGSSEKNRARTSFALKWKAKFKQVPSDPPRTRSPSRWLMRSFFIRCEDRHRASEKMTRHNLEVYKGHVFNHILNPDFGLGRVNSVSYRRGSLIVGATTCGIAAMCLSNSAEGARYAPRGAEALHPNDWIAVNPERNVKVITPRGQEAKKIIPPSKKDIRRLLAVTENDPDFYVELLFSSIGCPRRGATRPSMAGHRFPEWQYQHQSISGPFQGRPSEDRSG